MPSDKEIEEALKLVDSGNRLCSMSSVILARAYRNEKARADRLRDAIQAAMEAEDK